MNVIDLLFVLTLCLLSSDAHNFKTRDSVDQQVDWMDKIEANPISVAKNFVCPDGQKECKSGQTCCESKNQSYECCPLANAVCCPDKLHCCPPDTECEDGTIKCIKID